MNTEQQPFLTISKPRTLDGHRTRGVVHLIHDPATGQTWCGRKFRGITNHGRATTIDPVTCTTCRTAYDTDRPRAWSSHH